MTENTRSTDWPHVHWKPLFDRLPGCELFEGELTGRRLLSVWALRDDSTRYTSDLDADSFWIELSGDKPDQRIWVRPDWIVKFFDKVWYLLPRAVSFSADGAKGLLRNPGERWLQKAEWQNLCGLVLREVDVANGYEPHMVALAFRFESADPDLAGAQGPRGASLLLDWGQGPEELGATAMLASDCARLFVWPLGREVQERLSSPRRDRSFLSQRVAAVWLDEEHALALTAFRTQWQRWLMAWGWTVNGCLPLERRDKAVTPLYSLLDKLAALETALGQGVVWQRSVGGWLDHDGDDFGRHWASLSGWSTAQNMAEDLWESLKLAWPMVAQDRYAQAWAALGLDLSAPSVRRRADGLAAVWAAYRQWWPLFQKRMFEGKHESA